jgi:hypothetical protein
MRLDLDKHLLECPLRLEKCEHCQIDVVVQQLARHHVLMCPKFPVNCPICGEAEIMRENVNSHINIISGDCPMVKVPCSFRHIGCMHEDQRCKMSKHYAEANTQHIMMLSTRLVALETNHRIDLDICAKKFEDVVIDLKRKLEISERRNELMETQLNELTKKMSTVVKADSIIN